MKTDSRFVRERALRPVALVLSLALMGLLMAPLTVAAEGGQLSGRVVDGTQLPIEGARVELDRVPADGEPEAVAWSDPFGNFSLIPLPPGDYSLTAHHPGYNEPAPAPTNLADGERYAREIILTSKPGGPYFDVIVEVADVTSNLPLGGVPVRLWRFAIAEGGTPTESTTLATSALGTATFRGLGPGHYRVTVNRPEDATVGTVHSAWEPYPAAGAVQDLRYLDRPHHARVLLCHVPQALTVFVRGYNPVADLNNQPLGGMVVELEGIDPADPERVVIPRRSGVTGADGRVLFTDLPSVPYRATVKRLGYVPRSLVIEPGAAGMLPAGDVLAAVTAEATFLLIRIDDDFTDPLYWVNGAVTLTGLPDTATAGITRTSTFSYEFPNTTVGVWDYRHFFGLLPGRYRLTFNGQVAGDLYHGTPNTPADRRPWFRIDEILEVPAIPQAGLNLANQPRLNVRAEAAPATLRGRLFAADQTAEEPILGGAGEPEFPPVYAALGQREGSAPRLAIELREYEPDGFLKPELRVQTVEIDEYGAFALTVPAGRYGVRVLEAGEYWGNHVQLDQVESGASHRQGWPLWQAWPFGGSAPANGTGQPGAPLVLQSGLTYGLDLFVHRKVVDVRHSVLADPEDPVESVVLQGAEIGASDLVKGGTEGVLSSGDQQKIAQLRDAPHHLRHRGVGPGAWSLSLSHPRNTLTRIPGTGPDPIFIPDWPDPGDLPTSDPGPNPILPLGTVVGGTWQAGFHAATTRITLVLHVWRSFVEGNPPATVWRYADPQEVTHEDLDRIPYRRLDYTPAGAIVRGGDKMPPGNIHFWHQVSTGHFFEGDASPGDNTLHIYAASGAYEGTPNPPLNVLEGFIPGSPYTLHLISANVLDPSERVEGSTIVVGGEALPANATYSNRTGGLNVSSASNPRWQGVGGSQRVLSLAPLAIEIVRLFERGLQVAGSVQGPGSAPVGGASIRMFNRHGDRLLGTATSGSDGDFQLAQALARSQPLWAEVRAPGFLPWRRRFSGADTLDSGDGNLELRIEAVLEPLPPPEGVILVGDRKGLFLPGVSRAGDASPGAWLVANEPLTLTWFASGSSARITVADAVFDSVADEPPPVTLSEVVDHVREAWLVDVRRFPGNPFGSEPVAAPPPAPGDRDALALWLDEVRRSTGGTTFHQQVTVDHRDPAGAFSISGQLPLWRLPPGPFEPVLALVSEHGGISVHPTFALPSPDHRLYGASLPTWLARATDALASINSLQATADQIDNYHPIGQLNLLPTFGATISVEPGGFLAYRYAADVNWSEGIQTPDSGLLVFAPGMIGVNFDARAAFGLDGAAGNLYLEVGTLAETESQPLKTSLLPRFAKAWEPRGAMTVGANSTFRRFYDSAVSVNEVEFETNVGADFDVSGRRPLAGTLARLLPTVGPVLVALEEVGAFTVSAEVSGGVGVAVNRLRATEFPPARESTSSGELDHVYERDLFGGQGPRTVETTPTLSLRFDVGVKVDFAGRASASATLKMTGNENANGKPSATITFNPVGDWPPIQRIQGAFAARVDAELDAWVATFAKAWEFELVSFDHQFGTESELLWTPMTITIQRLGAASGGPATFLGQGPILAVDLAVGARLDTVSGTGGDLLLFTDSDPTTQERVLRLARREGDHFGAAQELGRAAAIVGMELVALTPAGPHLALWSQISTLEATSLRPGSSIWMAVSTDGAAWSPPQQVAAFSGVATVLRWVARDGLAGLAVLEAREGPLSPLQHLHWIAWDDGAWSTPDTLESSRPVTHLAAASQPPGSAGPAVLAWLEADGGLWIRHHDGTQWAAGEAVATGAAGALFASAVPGFPLQVALVHGLRGGGIAVCNWTAGTGASEVRVLVSEVQPTQILVTTAVAGEADQNLLLWLAGAEAPALWAAWTAADLTPLEAPFHVSRTANGSVTAFGLWPAVPGGAEAVALYRRPDGPQLRTYTIGAGPPQPTLGRPLLLPGGGLDLVVQVNPGQTYRIEVSDDLHTWFLLRTWVPVSPEAIVTDATGGLADHRFYRLLGPLP